MYVGLGIQTAIHDHHAVQLIINLDGKFELQSKSQGNKMFKAVLIDSDMQHECITLNDTMLILNIAPESTIGKNLKKLYLSDTGFKSIDNKVTSSFIEALTNALRDEIDENSIVLITEEYLYKISKAEVPLPIDDRINTVLEFLAKHDQGIIKIKEIAAKVFMSESRLIHLFTKQIGIPIRKYLLWLRLVKAIQKSFQNNNITQAALDAGFSDAPHFNKTLKRMFGLNLTNLKSNQFIQAYWV